MPNIAVSIKYQGWGAMKSKKTVYTIFFIILVIALVIAIPIGISAIEFDNEVKALFADSNPTQNKKYGKDQLKDLPKPVQRYFKLVLKEGQPYINYVRLKHDGQFKSGLDKDWTNIEGEQYFTTQKPGFIWKGTTSLFTARDMYIKSEGKLVVKIASAIEVVNAKGKAYNQGELLRWLAENVWFPTSLLPSERLQWTAIDDYSAKLSFDYEGLSLSYIVTFNAKGEITQMETKRNMTETRLETWIIKILTYKEMNNILVPNLIEAFWRLEKGDFSYAKFHVKEIQYDVPFKY